MLVFCTILVIKDGFFVVLVFWLLEVENQQFSGGVLRF
jgi:hypothetical protein